MTARQRRQYHSELRKRRALSTREVIVDAAARLLAAERPPSVSVPEVADAAGVGVATVYRHFATKDELFDAVYDRWMASARQLLRDFPDPDLEGFLAVLPELWRRQSEDAALAAAMSAYAPAGKRVRARRRERRRRVAVDLLADVPLDPSPRRKLQAVTLLLTSTTALKHFRDHWDFSVEEAADAAAWAVRALVASARARG